MVAEESFWLEEEVFSVVLAAERLRLVLAFEMMDLCPVIVRVGEIVNALAEAIKTALVANVVNFMFQINIIVPLQKKDRKWRNQQGRMKIMWYFSSFCRIIARVGFCCI